MKIAIDSDDAGIELKRQIVEHLRSLGIDVEDLNLIGGQPADYPDVGYNLARKVAERRFDRGVLICGTGLGMAMIANKVKGVYAGVCHDVYSAERLSKSNDAQILTMGARVIGGELAKCVVTAWLRSEFAGGGSTRKVERLRELEKLDRQPSLAIGSKSSATEPRRILIGTNWKMNKTTGEAVDYTRELLQGLDSLPGLENVQVFLIPPFTAISAVKQNSQGRVWVGAQNMHTEEWGAFTGEISAPMLADLGVDLVELGHAERRRYFAENDAAINRKVRLALQYGLRALVCVGESEEEKQFGIEQESVARQVKTAFAGADPKQTSSLIIAYEPAWAIGGSGTAADVGYIGTMREHIRGLLCDSFGSEAGQEIPIIYGGDVNEANASGILARSGVDGLFIGRAALKAEDFTSIIRACVEAKLISHRTSGSTLLKESH